MARQVVGLISDTHGLLRPEASKALRGSDLILHAGDIGKPDILTELERLAPVVAIRGNVDKGLWASAIPETEAIELDGRILAYMLHNLDDLALDPVSAGFRVVVYGHSHKAHTRRKDGVLYINPGSAGPRRFSLPTTVGRLLLGGGEMFVEITELEV
ncbi:metallophosphoesterase family protein [Acidisphaera sp. L21]|uniref:metallophosphoesterase family protein n=1 Tax=Acidisphaera sp. L21 TaxID=1641851 RepID=UPI00131C6804|nr:metallophosphoesterase family protein [Acidisphaera sp. L21]